MPDQSYRTFLKNLEQQGHLLRFSKEVDPLTNLSAIEWRAYNEMGKSSLFTNIAGHPDWQVCSQILADRTKWSMAFGVDEDDLLDWLVERTDNPVDMVEVSSEDAPVQEVVTQGDEVDLDEVPAVITSEHDGGRYLASGMAVIRDPETGKLNVSIHRQQVFDRNTTGMIMVPRQARSIYDKYCARGEPMPVSFFYGAHPAIFFSAAFTTQVGLNELTIAGALMGEGVRTVKCKTNDLVVPAEAEMVLEGVVLPNELRAEGPFGEIVGTYADAGESEVFRVNAMTRRADPIHYGIHCGFPVTDTQGVMCLGLEAATKTHLQRVEGGMNLMDVRCLAVAGMMALVIKVKPRVEGQAKTALMAALSGPYLHPKLAIAVDEDIDADDLRQVMWSMTTRVHAERDVVMIPNTRTFALDKASDVAESGNVLHRVGTKWMIDATMPFGESADGRNLFEMAMPKNYDQVNLADFLPE